jgi:integrase
MGWLPTPLLHKRQWPQPRFQPKRSITAAEHERILGAEKNPEWNAFYRFCWHLGGSQTDVVSLHSYRYAWAERAMSCGYPERFAQAALGHNSKAMHRAYARHAEFTLPPLDEYERLATERKVVTVGFHGTATIQNPTSAPIDSGMAQ